MKSLVVLVITLMGHSYAFLGPTVTLRGDTSLQARRDRPDTNKLPPPNPSSDGEVGSGRNWIERSFPVDTTDSPMDPKAVEDYNLGLSGQSLGVGPLSARMYAAILERSSIPTVDEEIRRAFKIYAMDFTAKEAVRAALKQNGLELVLADEEQDEGMWADIDTIRLLADNGEALPGVYDSWDEAVDQWTPGQGFDFVARQVPAKMRELTIEELLQALDPDGSLRQQAKEAGMSLPDEAMMTLRDLADENVRRTEAAPRNATTDDEAFAGLIDQRGYQPVRASDLSYDAMNADGTENHKVLMHVMDALVSHGCLVVDLTDGGTSFRRAQAMADLWKAAGDFFDNSDKSTLPGMQTAAETGSSHAKVGYASYDKGAMEFLETRLSRIDGSLLPREVTTVLGSSAVEALKKAFRMIADIGKDIVRITVGASTLEAGAKLDGEQAAEAAWKLANELLDDGRPLLADIAHSEGSVSMSPHRLCRYSSADASVREVFGAHTDSTFLTAVPVAAITGLEVYDEATEQWYRPERAARQHWQVEQQARGLDPSAVVEVVDGNNELPWHTRYLVIMPGELLQLVTRSEIVAAVHRVVAADRPRLSSPVLLRGRPGTRLDTRRYVGGTLGDPILEECDGMTIEEIHDRMQPASFQ